MSFKIGKLTNAIKQEADKVYSRAFMKLWESGEAPPRVKVEQLLKNQGLLDTEKEEQKGEELRKHLRTLELTLRKGKNPDGTRMSKEQGRAIALQMRKTREEIANLSASISQYFNTTAESLASLERILFIVWSCTKKEDGTPFWPTFEDYKSDTSNDVAEKAMQEVMKSIAGVSTDFERQLYENSWLIKQGFMNEKYQLLDSKGRLVTEDGKLIDSEGNYIDENGNRIDYFGNPLDKDGNLMVEDGWSDDNAVAIPASVSSRPQA